MFWHSNNNGQFLGKPIMLQNYKLQCELLHWSLIGNIHFPLVLYRYCIKILSKFGRYQNGYCPIGLWGLLNLTFPLSLHRDFLISYWATTTLWLSGHRQAKGIKSVLVYPSSEWFGVGALRNKCSDQNLTVKFLNTLWFHSLYRVDAYEYLDWHFSLHSSRPHQCLVPKYRADCTVSWGMFLKKLNNCCIIMKLLISLRQFQKVTSLYL